MKKNFVLLFLSLCFIYLELLFKSINNLNIIGISSFFVIVVSIIGAILLSLLLNLFKRKPKVIIISIILFLCGVYFSAHTCLYKFYKFYFQLSSLALFNQVAAFASDGIKVVSNNALSIILFFVPFLSFVIFFRKFVKDEKNSIKLSIIILCICLFMYLPFALDSYGFVNKTFKTGNMIQIVNKNGVGSGLLFDIVSMINGDKTSIDNISENEIDNNEPEHVEYGYNYFDIDYKKLNDSTNNSNIVELNNYMANKTPTKKNKYTSFFEGKNLILFMAESFNGICVNPDLTPTLYKLVHNGFEFNNFYSPTNFSTIGGEFTELTSLFPDLGPMPNTLSIFRSNMNTYPMGIGNLFKEKGYKTFAYHDSTYDFQDRDTYLHNLGFDYYNACWLGLEDKVNCENWPASDIEMIDATFDDYINENKFLVFYATVSGHGGYSFTVDNDIAPKYEKLVKEYYGDSLGTGYEGELLLAYEAGQIELDRALENLIKKLETAGKLDDTVIALVGDHHPYYITENLTMEQYNKLSTYERDEYIELYHSNFILYNSAMEKVTIDRVGSQLDVIPTLYNLFGMNYDSRLLMGVDLLSSTPSIAIMADNSWVNDYGKYYAVSDTFEGKDGLTVSDSYVETINKKVYNIQNISKLIMKNNYYQFIYDNMSKS